MNTSSPRSRNASARCEPRKPAPPVIRTFIKSPGAPGLRPNDAPPRRRKARGLRALAGGRSRGDVSWRDLGGWRGARLPRRERASRRRTLDGQGQHGDDNRDGFRFVRWPRVRDTHPRRRQQHDVVIVAIVPETGDPRGIGRTGVCQGPCRGERADEEENEETPNAHGWTHTIGLLRVSSDWGCCGRRRRTRSRRRPRRLTRRYATSSGRATMMPVSRRGRDLKSTRLNSSHGYISYAVFCLKKKTSRRALTLS